MKKAKQGDHVSIEYEGTLESGETVEKSVKTGPVEIEIGAGLMPPGFEQALVGMHEGQVKTISLAPDEAFGDRDETLLHTVKKNVFGKNIRPKPGMVLGITLDKDGQPQKIPCLVTDVRGDDVTIDFNHPLAGKTVDYKLTLKAIK
ncbi:MAG: peptidylprolyl isomerase [Desulfobulbales bacterium]|nr:peptidylprolyl isomerase [Desulfobulbales bacterium]